MRILFTTLLLALFTTAFSQAEKKYVFKSTQYKNFYSPPPVVKIDTITSSSLRVNIAFYRKHFNNPYYLPKEFINENFKNQTISIWRDPDGAKDFKVNWENTYTYDSLGRITNYTFSGCLSCSDFPYNYSVKYNEKGQISQISNAINNKKIFKFYYNDKNDIIKLEIFWLDELTDKIELLN